MCQGKAAVQEQPLGTIAPLAAPTDAKYIWALEAVRELGFRVQILTTTHI